MCPPGQGPTRDRRRKKEKIGFVPEKIVLESEKIEWRLKMIVCAITRSLS